MTAVALIAGALLWLSPSDQPRLEWRRLTNDTSWKIGPVLSDGARLYFRRRTFSGVEILQIPVSGGDPTELMIAPPPGRYYGLTDISPDGQELLLVPVEYMSTTLEASSGAGPLWATRVVDGSTRRVGNLLAREAKYSPDGKLIAFTSGAFRAPASLWVASSDGSNPRRLLERENLNIVNPCWSADSRRITFGRSNDTAEQWTAWEIGTDGTHLRRLLPDFHPSHLPAVWTANGGLLFLSEGQFWMAPPRRFFQLKQPAPIQLSAGDPRFTIPIQPRQSGPLYTVGVTKLGQLQRFNIQSRRWEPHLGGMSAEGIEYSRDGQSLLYATYPEGNLWVRRADGSRPLQLTKGPMRAGLGRWSPDGRIIAFSGMSAPDQPWRIYLVDVGGGGIRPACPRECEGQDLTWMPDGKKIVFSNYDKRELYLRLLDLDTGEVTKFPGSEGLHSPHVSPDGSTLAACVLDRSGQLSLYRFHEGVWKKLPQPGVGRADWPTWSRDSQSIWYYNEDRGAIMRVNVRENRHEEMLPLKVEEMTGGLESFFNLTPDDEPMILRRRDVQQIYALELKHR